MSTEDPTTVLVAAVRWQPTELQRLVKARVWAILESSWRPIESYGQEELVKLAQQPVLRTWLKNGEFTAWFLNKNSIQQRLQAEAELALDTLVEVLHSEIDVRAGVTAAAKIKAAELILLYAGHKPKDKVELTAKGDNLASLPPEQLRNVVSDQMKKLISRMSPAEVRELVGSKLEEEDTDVEAVEST